MMDGRDLGPPPLLSGLAMDGHHRGAAAARLAPLGAGIPPPGPLTPGKYLTTGLNLHSHPGFSHLPNGLYPSYIPLSHLEPHNSGSPLLAQLGQHSLFESPKDGFYLPGHAGQPTMHLQGPPSRASSNHTSSPLLREKDLGHLHRTSKESTKEPTAKERACRSDLSLHGAKKESKLREESRPHSVVDLTQDTKPDSDRKVGGLEKAVKVGERLSPFFTEHMPKRGALSGEPKSKNPLQTSLLSNCGGGPMGKNLGSEQDRCARDPVRHDENMRPSAHTHTERLKRGDAGMASVATMHMACSCPSPAQPPGKLAPSPAFPPQPIHSNMYTIFPLTKEPGREHKVIAPTFVPSVEAYDERTGPIQIASQARDNGKEKEMPAAATRVGVLQALPERCLSDASRHHASSLDFPLHGDAKRMELMREKGSVIRATSTALRKQGASDSFLNRPRLSSPESREFLTSKDLAKSGVESEHRSCERERFQRSGCKEVAKIYGTLESSSSSSSSSSSTTTSSSSSSSSRQHLDHAQHLKPAEQKWKPFEMGNFATTQMAVLAAQHNQASRVEEEAKKAYLDPSGLQRASAAPGPRSAAESLDPTSHGEGSAMQSLIKYSGSFAKETSSRQGNGKKSPFGGLGNMKHDAGQSSSSKIQQLLTHQASKQLKKEPERPESAKSFGRESIGSQGEVEVRHLPVGIAVAVARQKDNSGGTKMGQGLADCDRTLSLGNVKGHGRPEEDCGDDRPRHRENHLLASRLERDQEKLLRESKELADFARLHPTGCATNGLNANLVVTGGPPLTASGRWSTDPASHLANHPWLPRTGASSMWLAGHPYGLGHPSLHQGMSPSFPPSMAGTIPSAYQFARDPQSGQLVVIPSEHLPHFELMDRAPPLWPAMYPPTRNSLQHAHQLQLLSHQQLIRQHELYILQQQAAHAMELHRSAQLVERLKASEQRVEMEEKLSKRTLDNPKSGLISSSSGVLHRKPPVLSPSTTMSYSKAVSPPLLSPRASPVSVLKAEVIQKMEEPPTRPTYSYPATPISHPSSPPPASPPPAPAVPPKEEEEPESVEKKEMELEEKEVSSPFQAMFPEISPGYPFQSLPASFRRHYPYLLQPTTASDADGLAPDVPQPAGDPECVALSPEVKPLHLSPSKIIKPIQAELEEEEEPLDERVKTELDDNQEGGIGEPDMERLNMATSVAMPVQEVNGCSLLLHHDKTFQRGEEEEEEEEQEEALQERRPAYQVMPCAAEMETQMEAASDTEPCPVHVDYDGTLLRRDSEETEMDLIPQPEETSLDSELPHINSPQDKEFPTMLREEEEPMTETTSYSEEASTCQIPALDIKPDDPLAGMNVLAAAAELPQASSLLPSDGILQEAVVNLEVSSSLPPEHTFLQGITLLSEIAELELEKRKQETQGQESLPVRPTLESLLAASTQMLMEVLSTPFMDSLKNIRLPRELNPNKKYSWMQKKDESMYSIKSAIENMDAVELDYRMRLAELQRRYKEKQRELMKLQRRRDSEEKHDEKTRSLTRRGPGRPRKRKLGSSGLSPHKERGKIGSSSGKLSKSFLLSEDSETGEGTRKRHRGMVFDEDEEEMEGPSGKTKGRNHGWDQHDMLANFSNELKMKKKKLASDQEQLVSKLDKALSLSRHSKLKSPFKFADSSVGRSRNGRYYGSRYLSHHQVLLGKDGKKSLAKTFSFSLKASKEGKNKMATKKKIEMGLKVKGHLKMSSSPAISEVSSYSYNTDSEDDDEFLKDKWSSHSLTSSRMRLPGLYSVVSQKSGRITGGLKATKKGLSAARTLKPKLAASRKQSFCLLPRDAEAGSSFSDSSDDSFNQGY